MEGVRVDDLQPGRPYYIEYGMPYEQMHSFHAVFIRAHVKVKGRPEALYAMFEHGYALHLIDEDTIREAKRVTFL